MWEYAAVNFWGVEANSFYSKRNVLNYRCFKKDDVILLPFFLSCFLQNMKKWKIVVISGKIT